MSWRGSCLLTNTPSESLITAASWNLLTVQMFGILRYCINEMAFEVTIQTCVKFMSNSSWPPPFCIPLTLLSPSLPLSLSLMSVCQWGGRCFNIDPAVAVYSLTEVSGIAQPFTSHLLYLSCQGRMSGRKAELALREMLTVCLRASERRIIMWVDRFKVTRESRVVLGREGYKRRNEEKRVEARGLRRCLVKVPRASGQTQTRQGVGHLGMSSCPLGSPNKVVEFGGKWFREDEGLNRCLCWLCACVYFSVCLYWPYVMKKGVVSFV